MADDEPLNHESFERLLEWLNPDRDKAWEKYQEIWERLIKIFTWRLGRRVEELAGEVIRRVEQKVPDLVKKYSGDPARYFYGVAYTMLREVTREEARFLEFQEESGVGGIIYPVDPEEVDVDELKLECLNYCLEQLSERDRKIILAYYQFDPKTKLEDRKQLATELGLSSSALWTRVSRTRSFLLKCVQSRLQESGRVH